ncbi:MAG: hypothetical protein COT74_03295 [Bdellovibrionales bacterium CG10_big_fil_rev_8_21_14_0_10_45_34]|nr:MAG: hypothetical protein COT74_03295 [Bdellovibrionales bacterium CG10_big_fil_rev_8_21_14_0_10_45_34]
MPFLNLILTALFVCVLSTGDPIAAAPSKKRTARPVTKKSPTKSKASSTGDTNKPEKTSPIVSFRRLETFSNYKKHLIKMRQTTCPKSTAQEFETLYLDYQREEPLPFLPDPDVSNDDLEEIEDLLVEKKNWIDKRMMTVERSASRWPAQKEQTEQLRKKVANYFLNPKDSEWESLRFQLIRWIESLKFLGNFSFPVDHLANRHKYEELKTKADGQHKKFFIMRKIWEDGAPENESGDSDRYYRTSIDTIYLKLLRSKRPPIDTALKRDLIWVFGVVEDLLKINAEQWSERFRLWESKVGGQIEFLKKTRKASAEDITELQKTRANARNALFNFVFAKQAQTYKFWQSKPVALQAAFTVDQILLNEVGYPTDYNEIDRRDIIRLAYARLSISDFNTLTKRQGLYNLLSVSAQNAIDNPSHLNVMFREDEFSFTIPTFRAVKEIFCPELSRWYDKIRKTNYSLHTAVHAELRKLKKIENPPLRYFSRRSMVGRIDISALWKEFIPLENIRGRPIRVKEKFYSRLIERGTPIEEYESEGLLLIYYSDNYYLLDRKNKKVFDYRDPDYFQFFTGARS